MCSIAVMLNNVVLTLYNNNVNSLNDLTFHFRKKNCLFFEIACQGAVLQGPRLCSIAVTLENVVLTLHNNNVVTLNVLTFHFREKSFYFLRLRSTYHFFRTLECALSL